MTDILVPTEQEGTKAVVKTWLKKVGDAVKVDDPIVELETDKVAVEVAATSAGVLSEILVADGAEVEPGTVLGRITSGGAVEETAKAMAQGAGIAAPKTAAPRATSTSEQLPPGIRKMLADNGLDARDVPFNGARLTREDIQAELDRRSKAPAAGVKRVRTTPCASASPSI
jgi:2-oxoglutarate dehydrogenase E2 component (dihydrolipoamide succinyltransferase)